MFNVVLLAPEIPPNTGSIGRLCLATGSRLHLVKPLGFSIDERSLRRAGLDDWEDVDVTLWETFADLTGRRDPVSSFHFLTTKARTPHWSASFAKGDYLVFGSESRGLPESLLAEHSAECLTIPMQGTRSLNLATAVGIVLYEAVRQQQAVRPPGETLT